MSKRDEAIVNALALMSVLCALVLIVAFALSFVDGMSSGNRGGKIYTKVKSANTAHEMGFYLDKYLSQIEAWDMASSYPDHVAMVREVRDAAVTMEYGESPLPLQTRLEGEDSAFHQQYWPGTKVKLWIGFISMGAFAISMLAGTIYEARAQANAVKENKVMPSGGTVTQATHGPPPMTMAGPMKYQSPLEDAGIELGWVVGVRQCSMVRFPDGTLRLMSDFNNSIWEPGEPVVASCGFRSDHEAPAEDCACGIYALNPGLHAPYVLGIGGNSGWMEVRLWGTVVQHEGGYRAQYAYPVTILDTGVSSDETMKLADAYGMEVLNVQDWIARQEDRIRARRGPGSDPEAEAGPFASS